MRTLDYPYLAANPEGDTKANFSVSAHIPEDAGVPLNPDGTRPSVTLAIESETYALGLAAMEHLNENPEELASEWLTDILTDEQAAEVTDTPAESGPPAWLVDIVSEVHEPFLTFSVSMVLSVSDEADPTVITQHPVELTITAPSLQIGINALVQNLTIPRRRSELAVALSPERDDDDDDYGTNEVLVIR